LKPFEYIDLVEIFCRDDPRFRAEWLYLMRFIKPVVKIPAHSGLGIHFGGAGSGSSREDVWTSAFLFGTTAPGAKPSFVPKPHLGMRRNEYTSLDFVT
jgi:hypothetical protein